MGKRSRVKQAAIDGGATVQVGAVGGSVTVIHLHAPDAAQLARLGEMLQALRPRGKRYSKRSKR